MAYARGVQDASSVGRAAAFAEHSDSNGRSSSSSCSTPSMINTSQSCTTGRQGSSSESAPDANMGTRDGGGANANPFVRPNGRGPRGIVGGGGKAGEGTAASDDCGDAGDMSESGGRISDADGRASGGATIVGQLQSLPMPYANLRERTFDMTKRGELTSANVWYAARRRDEQAGTSATAVGGATGGADGAGTDCRDRREAGESSGGGGAGGEGGGTGVRDVLLMAPVTPPGASCCVPDERQTR